MIKRSTAMKVGLMAVLLASLALTAAAAGTCREALAEGRKKLQAKDYAGAQAEAADAQKLAGTALEKSEALTLLAQARAAAGDSKGALAEYRRIADISELPADLKARAVQAESKLLAAGKEWEAARRELKQALALAGLSEPKSAEIRLEIARLFMVQGNPTAARAEYAALTNSVEAAIGVGQTFEAEKNWPAARNAYEQVLKQEGVPDAARFQAQGRIAETYSGEEDLAGLSRAVDQALALNGPFAAKAGLLLKLGDLAVARNEAEKGREAYGKISSLDGIGAPQKNQAAERIAHSYAEEGTVPPGMNSCDPFGLPRESQQVIFERETAAYLAANPGAKFALGIETPVRKIFRDKLWFRGAFTNRVALSAARNEFEAFQLCVIPLNITNTEPIAGVRLAATDLVGENGAKIPAADVKIWQVGYVRTRTPSYPTCHVGYWPDPLLEPAAPLAVEGHQLQPYWIRVRVAEGTAPGNYRGGIQVATATQGSQTLTLELRVRPFTLPNDSKLIFQALRYTEPAFYMNYYKIEKDAARAMAGRYAQVLIGEYKLFPGSVDFYDKNDPDFSRYDALMQPLMQQGMRLCQGIPSVKVEGLRNGVDPVEFKKFTDHLRQKGWLQSVYLYLSDEPSEAEYPKLREYAGKVKEMVPDVRLFVAESPHPGLAGFTAAWWSDVSTEDPAYNRERQKAGDLVLWYFCRIPICMDRIYNSIWDAPLVMIDRAAAEQRVIFWLAWKYKIDGIMIWAGNGSWYKDGNTTWPDEPWDPHLASYTWPYGGADNGNGVLFYPGKQGPLPSLRLEVLREGREDYEYLWLLDSLAGSNPPEEIAQALSVNPLVCITPHLFSRDPAAFYKERGRIADLIEQYQKKAK